jgi:RNA polymerase sigma-70 factor, ECF subfamily
VADRVPERSQQATLRELGDERVSELVERYVAAWESNDVDALVALLAEDVTLAMPPRPSWYRGRDAVAAFLAKTPMTARERWRMVPVAANGQLAFAMYGPEDDGRWYAHAIQAITLDPEGLITEMTAFLDPGVFRHFGLPHELTP